MTAKRAGGGCQMADCLSSLPVGCSVRLARPRRLELRQTQKLSPRFWTNNNSSYSVNFTCCSQAEPGSACCWLPFHIRLVSKRREKITVSFGLARDADQSNSTAAKLARQPLTNFTAILTHRHTNAFAAPPVWLAESQRPTDSTGRLKQVSH